MGTGEEEEEELKSEGKTESIRLFVGGLGEKVTSDELHKVFGSLGNIQSLDIIRTKGRSFAYVDFKPASHNSLAKLLSTYNGCFWKGGRLRLEKAKEHYLTRLRREWNEDAELANAELTSPIVEAEAETKTNPAEKALQKRSTENKQLRFFFPKLGKVKAIPFNGTGKHKYSFRRVEVPPLPTYFCDCDEHCVPHTVEEKKIPTKEEKDIGVNEKELNIMNSVMNRLFKREGISEIQMDEVKPAFEEGKSLNSIDSLKFDESGGESTEEEDDLVINIVRRAERVMDTQKSRFNENEVSKSGPKQVLEKQKQSSSQNRKLSDLHEHEANRGNEYESSTVVDGKTSQGHSNKQEKLVSSQPLVPNPGGKELGPNASWSQKSSWRELLGDGGNSAFNIMKVIPSTSSSKKESLSDCAVHSGSSKNLLGHEDQLQQDMAGSIKETGISDDVAQSSGSKKNITVGHGDRKLRKEKTSATKEKPTSDHVSGSSGSEKTVLKHDDNEGKQEYVEAIEEPAEAMTSNSEPPLNNPGRGSAWLHTSSWTQLLGGSNTNSFSIAQVLPGVSFGKPVEPENKEVANFTDIKYDDVADDVAEDRTMELIVNDSLNLGSQNNDDMQITQDWGEQVVEASTSVVEEKRSKQTREAYVSDITVGENCLFMRSAASLKEWKNAKASLSRSRKRKSNEM